MPAPATPPLAADLIAELAKRYEISNSIAEHLVTRALEALAKRGQQTWVSFQVLTPDAIEAVRLAVDRIENGDTYPELATSSHIVRIKAHPTYDRWRVELYAHNREGALHSELVEGFELARLAARVILAGRDDETDGWLIGQAFLEHLPDDAVTGFLDSTRRRGLSPQAAYAEAIRNWVEQAGTGVERRGPAVDDVVATIIDTHDIQDPMRAASLLLTSLQEIADESNRTLDELYSTRTRLSTEAAEAALHHIASQRGPHRIVRRGDLVAETRAVDHVWTEDGSHDWDVSVFRVPADNTTEGRVRLTSITITTLSDAAAAEDQLFDEAARATKR